ncbi:MAG: lipid kinase [Acidimicrobiia bacterium]|nr:lipid kinase [Acidimicrobiia bacterium]
MRRRPRDERLVTHLLVANAAAGSTEDEALEAAIAALEAAGPAADVELVRCQHPDDLEAALDRLEGRVLVMAGGDGSLHLAVNLLHDRNELAGVTLGLVPLGTGNDLARGVGIPLVPAEAGAALATGAPRRLDVLVDDDGGVVVNATHAGLGAEAADKAEGMKSALGPLAYPLGALVAGVRAPGWQLRVVVDGTAVHDGPTLLVGVGNGPSIGGGTMLCPDAVLDDGQLDVVVATGVAPTERMAFASALRKGAHTERDDVLVTRGTEVVVTGDPVRHDVDGELTDELPTRTYTVLPGAWTLITP